MHGQHGSQGRHGMADILCPCSSQTHPISESSPSWFPPSTIAWDNEVRGSFFLGVKEEMQTIRRPKWLSAHTVKAAFTERTISIWCWCREKSHQGFSTEQERVLFEQKRKVQTLNMIRGGELCSAVYRLSPHLWGKTYKKFWTSCFCKKIPKARVSCIVCEDNRCQNGKWNKRRQDPERRDDEGSVVFTWPFPV